MCGESQFLLLKERVSLLPPSKSLIILLQLWKEKELMFGLTNLLLTFYL